MFGFQTLACLHEIPVIRSSTDIIQNVYAKAKDTSVLIRFPCNVAEAMADKSLKIALTIANPLVKPLSGRVRVIDDYAVEKIRQIESKYPAITTPTEEVVNTFNEKTQPVRHAINSMKDTTTSTIQHGKETVANVATATVNKATGVADSVFTFCESRVPRLQRSDSFRRTGFSGCASSTVGCLLNHALHSVQSSLVWFRMLGVFFLLKTKQINDMALNKMQQTPFLNALPQRFLIIHGSFLEYFIGCVRPDERTLAELKKTKQQSRLHQQPPHFVNRSSSKPDSFVITRQSVVSPRQETVVSRSNGSQPIFKPQPDYSNMTDSDELHARLAGDTFHQSTYTFQQDELPTKPVVNVGIAQSLARMEPSDVDNEELLIVDQQTLDAGRVSADLEPQDDDDDDNDDEENDDEDNE